MGETGEGFIVFRGELAKYLSIREREVAEAGHGGWVRVWPLRPTGTSPNYDSENLVRGLRF